MRIIAAETLCLSRLHEPERQWITAARRVIKADAAIVVIHTDDGLTGIGEATPYGGPFLIRDWVNWLAQDLIGRDPRDRDLAPQPTGRSLSGDFPHINPYDCAVAGIDTALWDLRGKIAAKRLGDLLRGEAPHDVRLYASSGVRYDWRAKPETVIDEVLGYLDAGFTASKVRIGTEWRWDGVTVDRFLDLMRGLAQAVNGRMDLMVDGNGRLTLEQALPIAKELDRLGFRWFEEPLPMREIDQYIALSRSVGMAISGGEGFTTLEQFRPYLERRAISIAQPDVACCGLTEALRIARMAARYDVAISPHNWHNGLMALANAHFVVAIAADPILELCMVQGPLQWAILKKQPAIKNGRLELPSAPGLGVELAADLATRFPHIEGHYALPVTR